EDEAESLAEDIDQLALIAIEFPVFMDGRGFSNAAILRQQFNYRGELRAVGGFIRDQLCYLSRCGFNAFDLGGEDLEAALHSLQDLNEFYQASSDQPKPLFRRR
ncbi:MAG: DUF934 domain-containing protein, partial [Cellvibrionaceae bacterium]|nr:DUF934 domain-containing protein [Cellvibrionaceae bacterium]